MVDCEAYTSKCNDYINSGISNEAKVKVVSQLKNKLTNKAFNNPVKVRQALAKTLTSIPLELKASYESLLKDASYITIETALYNLWVNFPQEREKYLNQTKTIKGFNDNNIRILWLTLALVTEDFEPENKTSYFNELTNYTSALYDFETRQNAFMFLNQIKACNEFCKSNLKEATKHHNWRFSSFAKELIKE